MILQYIRYTPSHNYLYMSHIKAQRHCINEDIGRTTRAMWRVSSKACTRPQWGRGRDSGATNDKKRKREKNVTSHYLISMEFMEIALIKLRIPVAQYQNSEFCRREIDSSSAQQSSILKYTIRLSNGLQIVQLQLPRFKLCPTFFINQYAYTVSQRDIHNF